MTPSEKARRLIVNLVMVIYLLLIFEGSLRKWVLTSYGQWLFFVRDPFVLAVYWLALRNSYFPKANRILNAGIAFAALGLFIVVLQSVGPASGIDQWPLLAAYGWRNYFLYIPLAFIIGETFQPKDLQRVVKFTLALSVPIAILVVLQFRSPLDSPINIGFAAGIDQQYHGLTVDAEHTRPMGTFTSDVGQKLFDVSCMAMLLSFWIVPASRRYLRSWQIIIATCAVLTCLAVGGSRSAMIGSAIVLIVSIACAAILRGSGVSTRAVLLPSMLAVVAVALYPIVFPDGYDAFVYRWNGAAAAESQYFSLGVFGRALYGFVEFFNLLGDAPFAGYGLGLAGNASLTLGVTIPGFNGWAENDWSRHIVDLGPVFGIAFIVYRITLAAWMGSVCLVGARRMGNPLPLLLFAYIGVDLLYGELTGHGTVNGYGWLFGGWCLAASKMPMAQHASIPNCQPQALRVPRFANLQR